MDSCGGGGGGGGGGEQQQHSTSPHTHHTTLTHTPPNDKDRTNRKPSEKLLAASGEQWSVEENNDDIPVSSSAPPLCRPMALPLSNGVNGLHLTTPQQQQQQQQQAATNNTNTTGQSLLNNNLVVEEKCNLRKADDKTLCLYHKFPAKVNNNLYPDSPEITQTAQPIRDGMDEYYMSHRRNDLSPPRDQLNLLNGEEVDEDDGCIYTYKGESMEANLSHLIDMCLSCGLPNPERNGARPKPPGTQHHHESNLFSPDMDFLEMDFDPGPGGEGEEEDMLGSGGIESDSEDNCLHSCDTRLRDSMVGPGAAAGNSGAAAVCPKPSNYCPPEMLSLMCRRCENSLCDSKIDNVASNITAPQTSKLNIGRADQPIRPTPTSLNLPRGLGLNVGLNQLCLGREGEEEEEEDGGDNDSVENNLLDIMDHLSDDADDEDESNSERYEPRLNQGATGGVGGCWEPSPTHTLTRSPHVTQNNNLGSISAPEVSPAKEYSPLEKFGRSLSFHNQLSSPKYENVCFGPRPRREEHTPPHPSSQTPEPTPQAEAVNIAACSGRLRQRENSVFNILSDSTPSQSGNCSPQGTGPATTTTTTTTTTITTTITTTTATTTTTTTATTTTTSHTATLRHITTSRPMPDGPRTSGMKGGGSGLDPCPLPVKSLKPKNTNPAQDPNTASEGEGGGDESCPRVKKVMIWTELQASARQVTQIATSACGATAVINVMLALDYGFSVDDVKASIKTRLRAETAPLVDYLLSRSVAGTTHQDLIQGVTLLSKGAIKAKFFHMFPKRVLQLSRWLAQWISKGGVPVATLNLQVGVAPGQTIPDAWHHQMIFGVGPQGVYLTNPLECVSDCMLGDQLCTDSVLLVRRADVVNRWGTGDKLIRLTQQQDTRWKEMNVLGQVVGVLKEQAAPPVVQGRRHLTSHVCIPAAYKSGVTIFMRADNPHLNSLTSAEQLPLLE